MVLEIGAPSQLLAARRQDRSQSLPRSLPGEQIGETCLPLTHLGRCIPEHGMAEHGTPGRCWDQECSIFLRRQRRGGWDALTLSLGAPITVTIFAAATDAARRNWQTQTGSAFAETGGCYLQAICEPLRRCGQCCSIETMTDSTARQGHSAISGCPCCAQLCSSLT